jgi:hypothetical protein
MPRRDTRSTVAYRSVGGATFTAKTGRLTSPRVFRWIKPNRKHDARCEKSVGVSYGTCGCSRNPVAKRLRLLFDKGVVQRPKQLVFIDEGGTE